MATRSAPPPQVLLCLLRAYLFNIFSLKEGGGGVLIRSGRTFGFGRRANSSSYGISIKTGILPFSLLTKSVQTVAKT